MFDGSYADNHSVYGANMTIKEIMEWLVVIIVDSELHIDDAVRQHIVSRQCLLVL